MRAALEIYVHASPPVDVGEEEERPGFELLHIRTKRGGGKGEADLGSFLLGRPPCFPHGEKEKFQLFFGLSRRFFFCPLSPPLPCSLGKLKRRKKGRKEAKIYRHGSLSPVFPAANELWMSLSLSLLFSISSATPCTASRGDNHCRAHLYQ